jgi:tetratricopeptide (TPR) repeat protein
MKKFMMFMIAALALSSAASAQKLQIDEAVLNRQMANADAAVADPKKGSKPAAWIARGDVYFNVGQGLGQYLYVSMPAREIFILFQENPQAERTEELKGKTYQVISYPGIDIYVTTDTQQIAFWRTTKPVREDAYEVAMESYRKAIEIDPKQEKRLKEQMNKVLNQYRQEVSMALDYGENDVAARTFAKIYDLSQPPYFDPDTLSAFNAGNLFLVAQEFEPAIKYLEEVRRLGYDEGGEVHYYLNYAYKSTNQPEKAEAVLREGVMKYPGNPELLEELIILYTSKGEDASSIIPLIEEGIKKDPKNHIYRLGLGMIYDRLGDFAKAEESLKKAVELAPENYIGLYNLAALYVRQSDAKNMELGQIPLSEQVRKEEKIKERDDLLRPAIPLLERAHNLKPEELSIIDLLKSIYFRFRTESPEMLQNFEKYDALYKSMAQ